MQPKDLKRREWRSAWERERGRERERESMHAGEDEGERALWLLLVYVSLPLGLPDANWA